MGKNVSFVEMKKKRPATCPIPLMYALTYNPVCKLILVSKTLTSIARRIRSFIPQGNKFPIYHILIACCNFCIFSSAHHQALSSDFGQHDDMSAGKRIVVCLFINNDHAMVMGFCSNKVEMLWDRFARVIVG